MRRIITMIIAVCLLGLLAFIGTSKTYASSPAAADIDMQIKGTKSDNRYFLCVPNIGCLSILAGDEGKVYPVFHSFQLSEMDITDVEQNFSVTPETMPRSCDVTVNTNQSVVIKGDIIADAKHSYIENLHCVVKQN